MNLPEAIDIIEEIPMINDPEFDAGEAWETILEYITHLQHNIVQIKRITEGLVEDEGKPLDVTKLICGI